MSFRPDGSYRYDDAAWRRVRTEVLERDGGLCQVRLKGCTVEAAAVDHIIPVSDGGTLFDPANLRACCRSCNATRAMFARRDPAQPKPSREW